MRDAFPIVASLGERFQRERTGWRDAKALIVLVAQEGDWQGASALADALGINPDAQEAIYLEVATKKAEATCSPTSTQKPPALTHASMT